MKVIVTGCAGFIGYHATQYLLARGDTVVGIDNLNPYYDVTLKHARLAQFKDHHNFTFYQKDISDKNAMAEIFQQHADATHVLHLAAQAGVRYSLIDPYAYVQANVLGHLTLLEATKLLKDPQNFVYASSSSVYGANTKMPFAIEDPVDHPISLYAASKRSCELISECYHHLFQIPQTGLRFFTVYGPWGRPDMAAFIFMKGILAGEAISVFNNGNMRRNFTYVDDIIQGTIKCLDRPLKGKAGIYNIGNNRSESLMDFIHTLEDLAGRKAIINYEPLQAGDVPETIADIKATERDFDFAPTTNIQEGLQAFVEWYMTYYGTKDQTQVRTNSL